MTNSNFVPRLTAMLEVTIAVPAAAFEGRSVEEVKALIERAVNASLQPADEQVVLGWTKTTLRAALARLRENGYVGQAAVIEAGLQRSDGKVSRETAHRLDQRSEAKSFRGFTKPVIRTVESMRSSGQITSDAVDLLKATYAGGGTAAGFEVRPELADLL